MILKFKLEFRLKIKYRPFLKTIVGGERGGGKFYAPFYCIFYCTYLYHFYALLKAYFRREKCPCAYSTGADFCTFYECL